MPHTPSLCIDSRTALELPHTGAIAQELIDQLVAANGEEEASEWIQKHRTVLLTHPGQVFSGQLRRYETKRKVGVSPLYWLWEKEFVKMAGISFFHRFRAIDQMNVACSVSTLTTVLPPKKKLPFFLSRRPNQYFSVPSETDKLLLQKRYLIAQERIFVSRPTPRRLVHFNSLVSEKKDTALILVDKKDPITSKKLLSVLKHRYPNWQIKTVSLRNKEALSPKVWLQHLSRAGICFYLCSKPFDWGTLALESIFYGVPTVFLEENKTLMEMLPNSGLTLTRFLVENPELTDILASTQKAGISLKKAGIFDPLAVAEQYRLVYEKIAPGLNP